MNAETKRPIKDSLIETKNDELHYLNQVIKYLNHLLYIYQVGKLEDVTKAFGIKNGLENYNFQKEKIQKELNQMCKESGLEQWRTFDQS